MDTSWIEEERKGLQSAPQVTSLFFHVSSIINHNNRSGNRKMHSETEKINSLINDLFCSRMDNKKMGVYRQGLSI